MSFFARISFIIAFLLLPASVSAMTNNPADSVMFSASGIKVDVTADNAAMAREEALKEGQKKALMIVMARLTPPDVLERLPELIPDNIINLVQDMSVSNEKTSAVRYIATLEIRFNADGVRSILKENRLPFVKDPGKTLLVLPLLKKSPSSTPLLFEEDNAWLRSWINRTQHSYMVPLSVPLGELSDIQTLSAEKVVNGDLDSAKKLAVRYGAKGILIVEMTRKGSVFSVSGKAMDDVTASEIPDFKIQVPLKQNSAKTYAVAVGKVVEHIENVWKNEQMVQFNEPTALIAMLPVTSLDQWETISERLERIPSISSFSLQAARPGLLQVTVFYAETLERLQKEMNKRMLSLTALPGGVYKLQAVEDKNYFWENETSLSDQSTIMPQQERVIKSVPENTDIPPEEKVVWQVTAPDGMPRIKWQTGH